MELASLSPSKVLVVEGRNECVNLSAALSQKEYPAHITSLSEVELLPTVLENNSFDIIVLDCELANLGGENFFRSLLLADGEPRSIMLLQEPSAQQVQQLQAAGCSLCLSRREGWKAELATHVVRLSRLKRAEAAQALARAKQLELNRYLSDKNRRLEDFSMTIAHDIRGPLGGIAMNLEYVLDTFSGELPSRCRDLIHRALQASGRLTDLVQEMYQYAKLGSLASKMNFVNLEDLVSEVESDLGGSRAGKVKELRLRVSPLPEVWGNKDLLRRVFLNLFSNTLKYSDKEIAEIAITHEGAQNNMLGSFEVISIADNGPGIPAEDQQRIFWMFDRGAANGQGGEGQLREGLGVGLAVVQRIVELHLGSIQLDASTAQGTRFLICLPSEQIQTL